MNILLHSNPSLLTFPVIIGNKEHQRGYEATRTKIKPCLLHAPGSWKEKRASEPKKQGRVPLVFFLDRPLSEQKEVILASFRTHGR